MFLEARKKIASIYYSLLNLLLKDDSIRQWHEDIDAFVKPWKKYKAPGSELPDTSKQFNLIFQKYHHLLLNDENLQIMILRHSFCQLLKKHKKLIQNILNGLDNRAKILYVTNFQLRDKADSRNSNIVKKTYLPEFIEYAFNVFSDKNAKHYITALFKEIFKAEFSYVFLNCSRREIEEMEIDSFSLINSGKIFGEVYTYLYISDMKYYFTAEIEQNEIYRNYDIEKSNPSLLDIYFSVPLTKILFLLICTKLDFSALYEEIKTESAYLPGYSNDFGFENINNFGEILTGKTLKIKQNNLSEISIRYLPILIWRICSHIDLDSSKKVILSFDNQYEVKGLADFSAETFQQLLLQDRSRKKFPISNQYRNIAVNQVFERRGEEYIRNINPIFRCSNYSTYLWDNFKNICEKYQSQLLNAEDKEKEKEAILNEIMPSAREDDKPVTNLLRYIYHHRAYDNDLPYGEAWKEIHKTYREFAAMVLDCIPLEDEEENKA